MIRLNTDNLAAFFPVETTTADSPALQTEPEAKPFDAFLQRAGQSPDTGSQDDAPAGESGPIDAPPDSTEQDLGNPTEPDREPEEDRETAEATADVANATPKSDEPDASDTPSDDETDERVSAAGDESSDENTDGKKQAAVKVDVAELGSTGGVQETLDEGDSTTEEAQSRDSRSAMKNRHEDHQSESEAAKPADAAKQTATSGRSEEAGPAPLEPEAPTEEEKPSNLRQQDGERKPSGPSEDAPKPTEGTDEVVTESKDKPKENASSQSRVDNPLDPAVSPQERRTSSQESPRQSGRQGSTRAASGNKETHAADQSSQTVAQTLVGQEMASGGEQVNADEIGAAPEETKSETQEKTVKPASNADLKATSATPPKGWSPEGLRSPTAPSTSEGAPTDQVDRVRFIQRVARAFEALGEGNGSVRLRLKPPELGGLRLEVSVRNGMMTAHIETETSAARTLLLDNLPALRERLAQQNIKVDSFDVDLADRQPDGSPQRPDDDRQSRDRTDEKEAQAPKNQDGDTADVGSAGAVTRTGDGARLDVVI